MTDDTGAWAAGLGLAPGQAGAFARLAAAMGSDPGAILRLMVERVIGMDEDMRALGLRGVAHWTSGRGAADVAADHGLRGLPLDVRPTAFMWPADVPFPWGAEECRAAVLGYQVKWTGTPEDFDDRLRGMWEMSDGYAFLLQR
jgi:hypothetical protein